MKRLKRILSMTVAGLFLATAAFGAVKQHKDLTGSDLHICKLHASTHAQGSTDPLTNSTAEGMTGLTAFTHNIYTYQKDDLADDGTVTLPDATSGMVIVTCNAESGLFHVQTDGTVDETMIPAHTHKTK